MEHSPSTGQKYQAIIYEKRISLSKNKIVNNIKDLFNKNKNMASYSVYLSSYMLDEIFNNYLLEYVGKIDIDDKLEKLIETMNDCIDRINNDENTEFVEIIKLYC